MDTLHYSPEVEEERAELGKPDCELVGQDGNAYAIMGRVQKALRRAGYSAQALQEYAEDSTSGNYAHLVYVATEWVEDVGEDEDEDEDEDEEWW